MNPFPAVAIGGPPHSGKSVLTYWLTRALRDRGVDHYVLRASPDGEGDWSQETPPETVRLLRVKGPYTPDFFQAVGRHLQQRHLPLLVDMGGLPTPDQETFLEHCTHAILLAPRQEDLAAWRERMARYGLVVLAELRSSLDEPETLHDPGPPLRGVIHGLERHRSRPPAPAEAPVFAGLLERLAALFRQAEGDVRAYHLRHAPTELTVDLDRLLQERTGRTRWQPQDLAWLLDYLPRGEPLAFYGRAPLWVFAAGAVHALPGSFFQFDARLGWVKPLDLTPASTPRLAQKQVLDWRCQTRDDHTLVHVSKPPPYLDYEELQGEAIPWPDPERGIVLSGKLPLWVFTGLARRYAPYPWLAFFHPPLGGAVVAASHREAYPVGRVLAYRPDDEGTG